MNTHDLLVKARNDIARCGWKSSGGLKDGGPRCAGNALYDANGSRADEAYWAAVKALYGASGLRGRTEFDSAGALYDWNDAPGRTKEEVLAAFDEAIRQTSPDPMDPFISGPVGRASFREKVA